MSELGFREGYLRAAAVLAWFDPATLKPDGVANPDGVLAVIANESRPAPRPSHPGAWTLRSKARREGLQLLGTREAMSAALARNEPFPDPTDNFQRMFAGYIRGDAPPLERQSAEELGCSLQAVLWLTHAITDGLPAASEIRWRRSERQLFEPFEALLRDGFAGREDELARLRQHVGLLPTTTITGSMGRAVVRVVGRDPPPLSVHGPGGVGKSTLVAKFLLEHAAMDADPRVPFVSIDFEDSALDPYDWRGWVDLGAAQLAVQARPHYPPEAVQKAFEDVRAALDARSGRPRSGDAAGVAARVGTLARMAAGHSSLADALWGSDVPFLVVVDSLEELQHHGAGPAVALARVLTAFTKAYPSLRIVLIGRAPSYIRVVGRRPRQLEVKAFDMPAAVAYLKRVGVDAKVAEALYDDIGGQPLSLRLAARALADQGGDYRAVRGIGRRRLGLRKARDAAIQGQLYGRILGHLNDPEVEALAEPGFVVRRITAPVIAHVLQPATGREPDDAAADRLMQLLRRERALVVGNEADVIRYRPQVRQEMLRMIESRNPDLVRAVDTAAFVYYVELTDPVERAEAIYHGLRLGDRLADVERLWVSGIERHLANVDVNELRARERAFLSARLGREVDPKARYEARFEDWERQATATGEQLLAAGAPLEALERLSERPERPPGSPLRVLEARVLIALERYGDAQAVIAAALEDATDPRFDNHALQLHELAAEVARHANNAEAVRDHLDAAIEITDDSLRRLRLELKRLGVTDSSATEIHSVLVRDFEKASDYELASDEALVREVAKELGPERPDVLRRAVDIAPVRALAPEQRENLADALADCDLDPMLGADDGLYGTAARNFDVAVTGSRRQGWREILGAAESRGGLNDMIKRVLALAASEPMIWRIIASAIGEAGMRDVERKLGPP